MSDQMKKFGGDLSTMWRFDILPPIKRLSWWWWWFILVLPDPKHPERSRQLMVLWSTKETPSIRVNNHWWKPGARMAIDEHDGHVLPGMVCAWWYDGDEMHEPARMTECRIAAMRDTHPDWPGDGMGIGGGAVVPLTADDLSFGMLPDLSKMWLSFKPDHESNPDLPKSFEAELTPWWERPSSATYANNVYALGMGYDILRIHAMKASVIIDEETVEGSAYFQKVTVQAPSVPWFWGFLHFDDGTYLDWFLPHISGSMSKKDSAPWSKRDSIRWPSNARGLMHDRSRGTTEKLDQGSIELIRPNEPNAQRDSDGSVLPTFRIRLQNNKVKVELQVRATSRAHWTFDQPTRAGLTSHLTYNEYPLEVEHILLSDENGERNIRDFKWIRGNAEHAWGILN